MPALIHSRRDRAMGFEARTRARSREATARSDDPRSPRPRFQSVRIGFGSPRRTSDRKSGRSTRAAGRDETRSRRTCRRHSAKSRLKASIKEAARRAADRTLAEVVAELGADEFDDVAATRSRSLGSSSTQCCSIVSVATTSVTTPRALPSASECVDAERASAQGASESRRSREGSDLPQAASVRLKHKCEPLGALRSR